MNRFVEFVDHPCSIEEHHKHPALGSTSLKRYLADGGPSPAAAATGKAVHAIVVDEEPSKVIERPAFGGKGSVAAKAAWEKEHEGVYHFAPAEHRKVLGMAKALQATKSLMQLLEHTAVQREHTVLAKTDTGIWVKARPDIRAPGYIGKPVRMIVDIKTTGEPDDDGFSRAVANYGYDMQAGLYGDVDGQRHNLPVLYWLYAVCKVPSGDGTHRVMRQRVTEEWMHIGRQLYEAAVLKAEYHQRAGHRAELHWEGDRVLPAPKPWHAERAERILDHARQCIARLDE